ncbi:PAS domain S-box-containing protein [Nocardioides sp. BE266]|uniref:PAS domain-containing sensor histidine kinase n=1 Tax=Nocardioides sp. BE266 TaxID=2817725 RepID=UPI002860E073|nr:ATP-binding protein [Nocardioides sp. BE266]MDR7251581.1 PAS domain S-box-containing protein [Nocardioides sp. BE266]
MTEDHLAEAAARYASLFTHHPQAAWSLDGRGYFTDANSHTVDMTGLSLDQLRQAHFGEVIHPDDLDLFQEAFHRVMAGEPQLLEGRVIDADGEVTDIRCTAIPVVVHDQVVGVHGISEDVTEAKRVLRELEEANAAKTLFLATVSHEVRTPLAALVGATELLMDTDLAPESAHYAKIVHRSSERLMRLVHDILEFSGLEAHQTVLHPRPFGIRATVADVEGWAVPLAESRGLTASFVVDPSVPAQLVGDCRRISQVVTNLVHNAITFTEDGGVEVSVTAEGTPSGPWVEFTVRDTGVGIAEDQLPGLFSPFRQVDPHGAGDRRGMGLGLAISRELVDLMGGRLGATSTPGEGSTFTAAVPLAPVGATTSPM